MLKISPAVRSVFEREARGRWLEQAIATARAQHPDWCRTQQPEAIRATCEQLHAMSETYDLKLQASFLALLAVVVEAGYDFRPTPWQQYLLARPGFSEEAAVLRFFAEVRSGSQTLLLGDGVLAGEERR